MGRGGAGLADHRGLVALEGPDLSGGKETGRPSAMPPRARAEGEGDEKGVGGAVAQAVVGGGGQGCIRREGTSEAVPEAVKTGGCRTFPKRLGAVTVGYNCH